jgi:hypothetical protein
LVLLGGCSPAETPETATIATGSEESEFARKTKCFEVGRLLYEDLMLGRETSSSLDPLYTYSKELNTCVAYLGWFSFSEGQEFRTEFLIDVLSNMSILESLRFGADAVFPSDEFDRQKKAFFPDAP